jgi:hypothetical protein
MASTKQLAANRTNAKRSTGPKSALGKSRSGMNSCTHGLTAQQVVIGDEDPAQFGILVAGLEAEYEPQSMLEVELVGRLAGALWRLRRIPRFEAALIEARRIEVAVARERDLAFLHERNVETGTRADREIGLALIQDSQKQDTLGKLSRYEAALLNVSTRTLQQLLFLQDRRARDDSGVVEVLALPVNGPDAASQ